MEAIVSVTQSLKQPLNVQIRWLIRRDMPDVLAIERTGDIERSNVLYCGTFSKTVAPGLRVGWVHLPPWLRGPMVRAKQSADLHTSTFAQRIIADLPMGRAEITAMLTACESVQRQAAPGDGADFLRNSVLAGEDLGVMPHGPAVLVVDEAIGQAVARWPRRPSRGRRRGCPRRRS